MRPPASRLERRMSPHPGAKTQYSTLDITCTIPMATGASIPSPTAQIRTASTSAIPKTAQGKFCVRFWGSPCPKKSLASITPVPNEIYRS